MKYYYESHRILLTPDFQHYDWHSIGYITKPQFLRVLRNVKVDYRIVKIGYRHNSRRIGFGMQNFYITPP